MSTCQISVKKMIYLYIEIIVNENLKVTIANVAIVNL